MTKTKSAVENQPIYQHAKGIVKDNAVMALLHDKLFRQRVEKKRKGKGSYQRKAKYASNWFEKPDDKVFDFRNFIIGFSFQFSIKNNKQRKSICQSKQKFYLTILGMSVSVIRVKKGLKATFETIYLTLTAYFEGEMCVMNLCVK